MIMFPHGVPKSKRILDLTINILGGVIIFPLMAIIAFQVRRRLGKPILFQQVRPGYHENKFKIYKFRTMVDTRDMSGNLLPDEARLTAFGRFLRSSSLDELPEIFNVFRGEMSWVGPRPLLTQYLDRYTPEQARRHLVLPGITGWAQINGRNILSWEDKFRLDTWYVDNWSLWLDIKILFITLWKVIIREGITQPGSATSEEFIGSYNPPRDES